MSDVELYRHGVAAEAARTKAAIFAVMQTANGYGIAALVELERRLYG